MSGYLESVPWNALDLSSERLLGNGSGTILTPREDIPSTGCSEVRTCDATSRRTASLTLPTELFRRPNHRSKMEVTVCRPRANHRGYTNSTRFMESSSSMVSWSNSRIGKADIGEGHLNQVLGLCSFVLHNSRENFQLYTKRQSSTFVSRVHTHTCARAHTHTFARDLHTIAPGPLERTCWRRFAAQ